jgi:hypothetical protein
MKTNAEMLEDDPLVMKAIDTTIGGQMSAEQLTEFVDSVVEQSEILQEIDVITGIEASEFQLDVLGLGSRIMRKGVEGTAPAVTDATVTRRTLNPEEVVMAFDITKRFLKRNIARGSADQAINALFAKQYKNDLVDLIFNGDKDSVDTFINIINGYIDRAKADASAHKDATVTDNDLLKDVFASMVDSMPNKWMNEDELMLVVSPSKQKQYQRELGEKNTQLGDLMTVSKPKLYYEGIEIIKVSSFPSTEFLLTPRKNLVVGIGQEMEVELFYNSRKRQREYTVTGYVDANYVISDAIVLYTHA